MSMKLEQKKFVHVVATLNEQSGTGAILYVNPASMGLSLPDEAGAKDVELVVEDGAGSELYRIHPALRRSSCSDEGQSEEALIQQDIPHSTEMRRVRLLYRGDDIAEYSAGAIDARAMGFSVDAERDHHFGLAPDAGALRDEGVTYSIMVRVDEESPWQAVAVGRDTAQVDVDANQFPDSEQVWVRVIRSSGFDDVVVSEQRVDLKH